MNQTKTYNPTTGQFENEDERKAREERERYQHALDLREGVALRMEKRDRIRRARLRDKAR